MQTILERLVAFWGFEVTLVLALVLVVVWLAPVVLLWLVRNGGGYD